MDEGSRLKTRRRQRMWRWRRRWRRRRWRRNVAAPIEIMALHLENQIWSDEVQ
jgi:hypothetical protein